MPGIRWSVTSRSSAGSRVDQRQRLVGRARLDDPIAELGQHVRRCSRGPAPRRRPAARCRRGPARRSALGDRISVAARRSAVTGSHRSTLVPTPGLLDMVSAPPSCEARPCTIDRPRPVPLPTPLVEKKGSTARARSPRPCRCRCRRPTGGHSRRAAAAPDGAARASRRTTVILQRAAVGHGVARVHAEVEQRHLELVGSALAGGSSSARLDDHLDLRAGRAADQIAHAVDQRGDVDRRAAAAAGGGRRRAGAGPGSWPARPTGARRRSAGARARRRRRGAGACRGRR